MKHFSTVTFKLMALRQKIIHIVLALLLGTVTQLHAKAPLLVDVHGRVLEENGVGVPGVSIKVKNVNKATTTDSDGKFTIKGVPDDAVLVISYIGYVTQEVKVTATDMVINLVPQVKKIDEVVVVGYGTTKKSDLTGAVGTVKAETLQERPASSLNQSLSGRVAGVNVSSNSGRPGGRANIRIRGSSSISMSNNPLYVIDGVILNPIDLRNGSTPIDYLNPNDIASIEVLKDASSAAIYGARGSNGVILVTTKRGTSNGGRVTYDPDFSVGVLPRKLALLNSKEFLAVEDLAYANAQKYDPVGWATGTKYTDPKKKRTNPKLFDSQGNPLYDTDWQDEAFQKAFTQNHQLGFTDGDEKRSIGAFLNYRTQQGLAKGSWQDRYAGRIVFDTKLKDWLKVGGTLSYADQREKQVDQLDGGGITMMRQVLEALPIIPVKYADGTWASNRDYPGMEGGDNPLRVAADRISILHTQTLLGNMFANVHLAPGLELKSIIGVNVINQREDYFAAKGMQYISDNGNASINNSRYNSWQFENYLTYTREFAKVHSLNAMAGVSWQHIDRFENQANTEGFTDSYYRYYNLGAGSSPQPPSSVGTANGLNSYFGRLNYGFRNRYLVTFTGRMDGSSKFGRDNQFAFFPSAALAWRVTEENFMKSIPVISNLKLVHRLVAQVHAQALASAAVRGRSTSTSRDWRWRSMAAPTSPANSGWARCGRDLNSGCACVDT